MKNIGCRVNLHFRFFLSDTFFGEHGLGEAYLHFFRPCPVRVFYERAFRFERLKEGHSF